VDYFVGLVREFFHYGKSDIDEVERSFGGFSQLIEFHPEVIFSVLLRDDFHLG
jgi:ribosomal 30S subunit maturation factor RimM